MREASGDRCGGEFNGGLRYCSFDCVFAAFARVRGPYMLNRYSTYSKQGQNRHVFQRIRCEYVEYVAEYVNTYSKRAQIVTYSVFL